MKIMRNAFTVLALGSALSAPAWAQMSPSQTNLDQSAARMEKRNAQPGQLTGVSRDQAAANALTRCADLPTSYRIDCEARVQGQGQVQGSVLGGGMIRETVTTMPAAELPRQAEPTSPVPIQRQ